MLVVHEFALILYTVEGRLMEMIELPKAYRAHSAGWADRRNYAGPVLNEKIVAQPQSLFVLCWSDVMYTRQPGNGRGEDLGAMWMLEYKCGWVGSKKFRVM